MFHELLKSFKYIKSWSCFNYLIDRNLNMLNGFKIKNYSEDINVLVSHKKDEVLVQWVKRENLCACSHASFSTFITWKYTIMDCCESVLQFIVAAKYLAPLYCKSAHQSWILMQRRRATYVPVGTSAVRISACYVHCQASTKVESCRFVKK